MKSRSSRQTCSGQNHLKSAPLGIDLAKVITSLTVHPVRLLIDSGFELTFATEQLISQLNIPRHSVSFIIYEIGESAQTLGFIQFQQRYLYSKDIVTIEAHILQKLATLTPSVKITVQRSSRITYQVLRGFKRNYI